eukprot:7313293-Pyramimonas_sp.AAC.1
MRLDGSDVLSSVPLTTRYRGRKVGSYHIASLVSRHSYVRRMCVVTFAMFSTVLANVGSLRDLKSPSHLLLGN